MHGEGRAAGVHGSYIRHEAFWETKELIRERSGHLGRSSLGWACWGIGCGARWERMVMKRDRG